MKLFKHKNHDQYVQAQIKKNKQKIDKVFAKSDVCNAIINYIKLNIPNPSFGICHGVRNGWEVAYFRKALNIDVIGTEISPTAARFKNVIQWDFHEVKPEWIEKVDFIYSNSFDHSYKPKECLATWMSCLKDKGCCFLEWSQAHNMPQKNDAADCFSASLEEYKQLINKKFKVVHEIRVSGRIVLVCINC